MDRLTGNIRRLMARSDDSPTAMEYAVLLTLIAMVLLTAFKHAR
jgi:Flp pilus assembly pilin Flp